MADPNGIHVGGTGIAAVKVVRGAEGVNAGGGGGVNTNLAGISSSGSLDVDSGRLVGVSQPVRPKKNAFQITSVTVGSRLSNDGGEDSADDLDESHTEDLSSDVLDVSKITDYEYSSEDAFSSTKDEAAVSTNLMTSTGQSTYVTVPQTTPVSIFSATTASNVSSSSSSNVSVTVVEAPNVPMAVVQHPEIQWQNRFRVVKIETSEPFRRGRWLCMDFLDPPAASTAASEVADRESSAGGSGGAVGTGSGNSSGTGSMQHGDSVIMESATSMNQHPVYTTWSAEPSQFISSAVGGQAADFNHGLTMAGGVLDPPIYPVSILLQTQQQGNLDFTNTALHMQARTTTPHVSHPHSHVTLPVIPGMVSGTVPSQPCNDYLGASGTSTSVPSADYARQQSEYSQTHGVNASVPVHAVIGGTSQQGQPSQTMVVPHNASATEYASVLQQHQLTTQQMPSSEYVHQTLNITAVTPTPSMVQMEHPPPPQQMVVPQHVGQPSEFTGQPQQTLVYQPSIVPGADYGMHGQQSLPSSVIPQQPVVAQSQGVPIVPQSISAASMEHGQQNFHCQPQQPQLTTTQQQQPCTLPPNGSMVTQPVVESSCVPPSIDAVASSSVGSGNLSQASSMPASSMPPPAASSLSQGGNAGSSCNSSSSVPGSLNTNVVAASGTSAVTSPPIQEAPSANTTEDGDGESLKVLAASLGEGRWSPFKRSTTPSSAISVTYSASGASTVAIDNKIEQAMDLVKSHLMFAVREEVDVLKERITELMDRINQLEYENSILKASASPDTLAKLTQAPSNNPPPAT